MLAKGTGQMILLELVHMARMFSVADQELLFIEKKIGLFSASRSNVA